MTNFKMTVRADRAVSACGHFPLSTNALAPWLSVGGWEVGLWTGVRPPPPPLPVASIQNKHTFLSTNLASLLAFEWGAARPHFLLQFFYVYEEIYKECKTLSLPQVSLNPVRETKVIQTRKGKNIYKHIHLYLSNYVEHSLSARGCFRHYKAVLSATTY